MSDVITLKTVGTLLNKLLAIRGQRVEDLSKIEDIVGSTEMLLKHYVEPRVSLYQRVDSTATPQQPAFSYLKEFLNLSDIQDDGRNHLFIIGDAGMGKTSLLAMTKLGHLLSFWPEPYKCEFYKLGDDTLSIIKNIPRKPNTVLLLDALDEDTEGFGKMKSRIQSILTATNRFKKVIITCRTQFMPSEFLAQQKSSLMLDVSGYICPIIKLCLFSEKQVEEYLIKRYPKDPQKRRKALNIFSHTEDLHLRPLLLSLVEDLIELNRVNSSKEIFDLLIENWLRREQRKLASFGIEIFREDLNRACEDFSIQMQLTKHSFIQEQAIDELTAKFPNFSKIKHFSIGGRSLLNRNADGAYRFAHSAIKEYLIAEKIRHDSPTLLKALESGSLKITDEILKFITFDEIAKRDVSFMRFENLNLQHTQFSENIFTKCVFIECDLSHTCFYDCDIKNALFKECIIEDMDISHADAENIKFENCKGSLYTEI